MNALHHVITVLPSTSVLDAAALATERKGILQTNGKVALIARDLLPGYAKVSCGIKKAA